MKRVWLLGALLCAASTSAFAQYSSTTPSSYGSKPPTKAEIVVLGGYAFTLGQEVYPYNVPAGDIDINDNGYYGLALDINVGHYPGKKGQVRLMYRREDSEVTYQPFTGGSPFDPIDIGIEYWQIGGLGGIERGKAMPFTCITLGATRFSADAGDEWKFSMIFGLGVKVYTEGKVGFMIQGNWPITFTDTWGGVTVGTGGAGVGIGGTGISQLDIGGGITISL